MAKSDWEIVKNTKQKPVAEKSPKNGTTKSKSPVASVAATKNAQNGVKAKDQKKKAQAPRPKIFELGENAVGRLGGTGTGTAAAINCLNLLTAEFTCPERIPPYDKDGNEFPSSKLPIDAKKKIIKILGSMKNHEEREKFLRVLVNNLISASRRAEGAWGARALGQILLQTYPDLGVVKEDILGTETHPGAVLSVIWLYWQANTCEAKFSVLFWLVLQRLKQKKVHEYLPKLLDDIQESLKQGKGQPKIKAVQVSQIILSLSNTGVSKNIQKRLIEFFNYIRDYLEPTADWIKHLLPHFTADRKTYALPLLIQAIEKEPSKSAEALRDLAAENRLQVKFVLEAVSFDTLSGQDRDIVVEALEAPMGKSSQVSVKGKKSSPVPSGKAAEKSEKCETSGGCFISKLFKYLFYSLLIVTASSQFACTRPYYEVYAQPYYNQYLKTSVDTYVAPVLEDIIAPKYQEFVQPVVAKHVIPNYNQFVAPQVKKGQVLFAKHVSPIVFDLSSKIQVIYKVHLEPQITSAVKSIEPARKQFSKEASKLLKSSVVQAGEVKKVWGKKCEEAIVVFHQKSEEFGVLGRKFIDDSYVKTVSFINDLNLKETALSTAGLVQEKSAQYFDQFLVATADQRAIIGEQLIIARDFTWEKASQLQELLVEYKLDTYLEGGFEFIGRSVIWIGDLIGELTQMRWCCATNRFKNLGLVIVEASESLYNRVLSLAA